MGINSPKNQETVNPKERLEILEKWVGQFEVGEFLELNNYDYLAITIGGTEIMTADGKKVTKNKGSNALFRIDKDENGKTTYMAIDQKDVKKAGKIELALNAPDIDPTSDARQCFFCTYFVNLETGEVISKETNVLCGTILARKEPGKQLEGVDKEILTMLLVKAEALRKILSERKAEFEETIEESFGLTGEREKDLILTSVAESREIEVTDRTEKNIRDRLREIVDTLDLDTIKALSPQKLFIKTPDIPSWVQDNPGIPDLEDNNTPFILLRKTLEGK